MKAIILAAGRGTRIQPITYSIPKPMIPIIRKPVMEFLIELLHRHGIRQIMVNTSYLAPTIEDYFRDGSRYGVQIAYSFEGYLEDGHIVDAPVGSGGALKKIQDHSGFFDETFLVLCGDALIDLDLTELLSRHRESKAVATIALAEVPRDQVSSYGVVVRSFDGRIREFQEKPSVAEAKSNTVNTGIYVFEPEVLERIPSGTNYDIGSQLFPDLVRRDAAFFGVTLPFQWLDIGKITDYYKVMQMALIGNIHGFRVPGTEVRPGIRFGLNVRADLSRCHLTPPIFVGGSSTLEPGCTIVGPTMIGSGCRIEADSHIEKSLVFDYTRIGREAFVRNAMISGKYCIDSSGGVVDLERANVGWIAGDARSPQKSLNEEQQELLRMLKDL